MDPLSLVANIIAVSGAAESASQAVLRLARIREAPEQVIQLQNEVSDARVIISAVQETIRQRGETITNGPLVGQIGRLIEKANKIFSDITAATENGLIKYNEDTGASKVSWRRWLTNQAKLEKLSGALCDVRRDIASALVLLTATDLPSIRVSLRSISMETSTIRDRLTALVSDSEATESNSIVHQDRGSGHENRSPPASGAAILRNPGTNDSRSSLRIRTSVHTSCRPLCVCVCHRESRLRTPEWMGNVIGTLFIGYSGVPTLGYFPTKCTEVNCRRNESPLLHVQYWFPSWFLGRMIILRHNNSPLSGSQISVRTPRVVGTFTPIFEATQAGNIEMTRLLFSQRKASPFDVAPDGTTPLMQAMKFAHTSLAHVELCKLLVREGADVEHEDMMSMSPVDQLWTFYLSKPSSTNLIALRDIFDAVVDLEESLRRREFTTLHKIILRLFKLDLKNYLEMSTADLERKCSLGRTPLLWAIIVGNIVAIRILVQYGADIEAADSQGRTAFGMAAWNKAGSDHNLVKVLVQAKTAQYDGVHNTSRTLKETNLWIKRLINIESADGSTPLSFATQDGHTDGARTLLSLGAETETGRTLHLPLVKAIQHQYNAMIKLLFEHEPKIDEASSDENENILHQLAHDGNLETISIIFQHRICCIDTDLISNIGNTPLQCFENQRDYTVSEDEETRLRTKEAFIQLLESIKIKSAIPGHDCWKDRRARRDAMRRAAESPEVDVEDSSSDDEFFETASVPDGVVGRIEENARDGDGE